MNPKDKPGGARLWMTRAHLEQLPTFPLPTEWTIRGYQPGDERHWTLIHKLSDPFSQVDDGFFAKQFGEHAGLLPERQFYLVSPEGEVAGTATAWFMGSPYDPNGRVHWVAVRPEYRGRGLAKPLLEAVCRKLKGLKHHRVCLSTSALRLPSIGLYFLFGFEPWIRDEGQRTVWEAVVAQLRSAKPVGSINS